MSNLILIKTFLHRHEAEVAKGLLEEKNIEAVISADDAGGAVPMASLGMGNVKLLVQEQDAANAKEALEILDTSVEGALWEEDVTVAGLPEVPAAAGDARKENKFPAWSLVLLGVIILTLIYFFIRK